MLSVAINDKINRQGRLSSVTVTACGGGPGQFRNQRAGARKEPATRTGQPALQRPQARGGERRSSSYTKRIERRRASAGGVAGLTVGEVVRLLAVRLAVGAFLHVAASGAISDASARIRRGNTAPRRRRYRRGSDGTTLMLRPGSGPSLAQTPAPKSWLKKYCTGNQRDQLC
ncbi:hypothetical protein GUJ93_ZPchr0013g36209 [Zizania palustris]|uniref:Uncharacterized protein n=1 Tax=Zizania palustris TaxID=103762 RepID=A0A8J6C1F2_ZIZPA|nr:hypothetical protein GUJ93_ZPchr0013g36209 [Zizania palustris]